MPEQGRRIRVLAADDSAVMRQVLHTAFRLRGGGHGTPEMELCGLARDGEEALQEIARLQPDALVLDMDMPRLDGLGVLRRLRDLGSQLPVVLCSAHTERGARTTLEALALGARDYVLKPMASTDPYAALEGLRAQLLPRLATAVGRTGHLAVPLSPMTPTCPEVSVGVL